jgi:hypothetical protein
MRQIVKVALPVAGFLALSFTSTACMLDPQDDDDGDDDSASIEQGLAGSRPSGDDGHGDGVRRVLRAAARATAPFRKVARAEDAGYADSGLPCIEGQGFHWLNANYLGSLDPETPAALVYARDHHGHLKLGAVEWIVPIEDPENPPPPPTLAGQTFHGPETVEGVPFTFYALHAWIWRHNADGLFFDANPDISCEDCQ